MRMPGAVDPQELLIRAMIGQQITVAAARTALTQLSACGSESLVPGGRPAPAVPHGRPDRRARLRPAAWSAAADRFRPCRRCRHGLRGPGIRLRRRPRRAAGQTPPAPRGGTVDRGIRCHAGHRRPGRVPGQRRRGAKRDPGPRRWHHRRTGRLPGEPSPDFREVAPGGPMPPCTSGAPRPCAQAQPKLTATPSAVPAS